MSIRILLVEIYLAKIMFALHGVDEAGKPELVRPVVRRDQLLETVDKLPPRAVGASDYHPVGELAGGRHGCHGICRMDRLDAPRRQIASGRCRRT